MEAWVCFSGCPIIYFELCLRLPYILPASHPIKQKKKLLNNTYLLILLATFV